MLNLAIKLNQASENSVIEIQMYYQGTIKSYSIMNTTDKLDRDEILNEVFEVVKIFMNEIDNQILNGIKSGEAVISK